MNDSLRSTPDALNQFCKYVEKTMCRMHWYQAFIAQIKRGDVLRYDVRSFISNTAAAYNQKQFRAVSYFDQGLPYMHYEPELLKHIHEEDYDTLTDNFVKSLGGKCL